MGDLPPLHIAARDERDTQKVQLLISCGADLFAENITTLHFAERNPHGTDTLEYLRETIIARKQKN